MVHLFNSSLQKDLKKTTCIIGISVVPLHHNFITCGLRPLVKYYKFLHSDFHKKSIIIIFVVVEQKHNTSRHSNNRINN